MTKTIAILVYVLLAFTVPTFAQDGASDPYRNYDVNDPIWVDEGGAEDGIPNSFPTTTLPSVEVSSMAGEPAVPTVTHTLQRGHTVRFQVMSWQCQGVIDPGPRRYLKFTVTCTKRAGVAFAIHLGCYDGEAVTVNMMDGDAVRTMQLVCPTPD